MWNYNLINENFLIQEIAYIVCKNYYKLKKIEVLGKESLIIQNKFP